MSAQRISADSVRAILAELPDAHPHAAVVVGVLQNGERRFFTRGSAGAGKAPLDEHTLFEIGSITKRSPGSCWRRRWSAAR